VKLFLVMLKTGNAGMPITRDYYRTEGTPLDVTSPKGTQYMKDAGFFKKDQNLQLMAAVERTIEKVYVQMELILHVNYQQLKLKILFQHLILF